mmetsp:Transcript_118604/g.295797  ORF Transcript_118604/g.295797 Transcript_118604/m.295797 type:complete len:196 (+) Transcript_118604:106-693(+)
MFRGASPPAGVRTTLPGPFSPLLQEPGAANVELFRRAASDHDFPRQKLEERFLVEQPLVFSPGFATAADSIEEHGVPAVGVADVGVAGAAACCGVDGHGRSRAPLRIRPGQELRPGLGLESHSARSFQAAQKDRGLEAPRLCEPAAWTERGRARSLPQDLAELDYLQTSSSLEVLPPISWASFVDRQRRATLGGC